MKFFIDTADIKEIREAKALGVLDGVTTNPSLIAKTGREFHEVVEEICAEIQGPISLEVIATDREGMVREGRELSRIAENVVVKTPMTRDGLQAARELRMAGIPVNMTLVFSPNQALLAAKVGATYVSPFIGRLDDVSHTGMDIIADIRTIFDNYHFSTQILVASIRNVLQVRDAALLGADVATIPFSVISQLLKHPLTDVGLAKFLADWEKVPSRIA